MVSGRAPVVPRARRDYQCHKGVQKAIWPYLWHVPLLYGGKASRSGYGAQRTSAVEFNTVGGFDVTRVEP